MATFNKELFHELLPNQLDLFSLPGTQTAVERMYFQDVRPISQLSGRAPIEFYISGNNGMEYLNLKNSQLLIKARIKKKDGTLLPSTEYVGPVNLLLPALFSQVDVMLNGRLVTATTSNYNYKAYIQTLLKYGDDAKKSQLTSQLWIKDTKNHLNDSNVHSGQNTGLYERSTYFAGGKVVELQGPIFHDIFQIDRFILNQVGVSLKFYRSNPEFYLITDESQPDYDLYIEDITLRVNKVLVNPAVIMGHNQMLQTTNAKYPFVKTEVKIMTLAAGQMSVTWDNIFQGLRPNKLVIGFTSSQASAGSYTTNPWEFKSYHLNQIDVSVDGVSVNGNPLKLSYDSVNGETTTQVLSSMFEVTGKWMNDYGMQLDRDDINAGFALYSFNLEPNFSPNNYLTLLKQGNVRLDAHFGNSLPETINCLVYAEYPGYFEINQSRDIIVD